MKNYSYEDIRKMRRGVNAFDIFSFPYLDEVKIAIRVLTQGEILRCMDLGREDAMANLKRPREIDSFQYGMIRLLAESVHKIPEEGWVPTDKFFESAEDVLELSREEVDMLQEYYEAVQDKYSPIRKVSTEKEFEALVEEIKKNKTLGNSLSSFTLRKLVEYLIQVLSSSQNDNGSGSSQWQNTKSKQGKKQAAELEVVLE